MNNSGEFLSKNKKKELEKELDFLKTTKRSEILEGLAFAKSLGDLSENADYHISKDEQGKNEARISQLEEILKHSRTVKINSDGTVGIGSSVVLKKSDDSVKKYCIVGAQESDILQGKVAFNSPIGEALMGKKKGDDILVTTPRGEMKYHIDKVS